MPEDLDTSRLEEEVAKIDGEETLETTTEETSEEKAKSTRTDTSLKTEEEAETSEKKEGKVEEEDRFDKHPRWQQLKQERDEALNQAKLNQEIRDKLGEMPADEILRLKNAGELLRKYPELATKIQKLVDEHPYGNEENIRSIEEVKQRQDELEQKLILKDYDSEVDKLVIKHKVDKDLEPYVKEILDNRVVNQKIKLTDVPKAFENVLKDIEKIRRKTLASHIESKEHESRVPASTTDKGKVLTSKKESAELGDIIAEMAEGLKAGSAPFKEE